MIDGLKPYPKMKDSGVPWLGAVPEHWRVRRLKSAFDRIVGGSTPSSAEATYWDGDIVWVTPADVSKSSRLKDSQRRITSDGLSACSAELVPSGSIIVTSRAPVGNVAIADVELCTNQGCKALVPAPGIVDPTFGFQVLTILKGELQSLATGTTFTEISTTRLGDIPIPLPPLPEQVAIVRFLDHADRRIRRYIRAKQKLIKLLEEQKQAIIHRAVTRGLDPNVRLKPSGVEWLGDVPEHWEVVPLKFLSERIQNGATPPTSEVAYYDNGVVPWYGPSSCAHGEYVRAPVRHLAEAAFTAGRARLIHGPALLVVVIGATAGRMALLSHDGATNQQITSYELRTKRVCPRFVLYQLRGAERWLRSTASTATIPILDGGMVSRLSVAIPSVTEQQSILRRIDEDTVDLEKAMDRARREIDLLREYRTRLIADVVTGKLDVREAAARLPDEAVEPEPLDEIEAEGDSDEAGADDTDTVPEEAEA